MSASVSPVMSKDQAQAALTATGAPFEMEERLIRGVATLDTVDGVPDEYLAAAGKAMDDDQLAEFERQVRAVYQRMVRIRIAPQWVRFYDFGAGRLPSFLAELVAG